MSGEKKRVGLRIGPESVRFSFDGREYVGQRGDSAASALLARGVRVFGRSVKYHRPRGLFAVGPEEPNALFGIGEPPAIVPNVVATQIEIDDDMSLRSQNRWPTLRYDLASMLQATRGAFGAGFYYKTFIWPSWRRYEGIIRRLAGLGTAPGVAQGPPAIVEHLSCDVLVGGAGPAGLSAALAAARSGAQVVICERESTIGGELEFEKAIIDGAAAAEWLAKTKTELIDRGARLLTRTTIVGGTDGLVVAHARSNGVRRSETLYRMRPGRFVVASGAVERSIAFVDNDRPGVVLLSAAERMMVRYGVAIGDRPVIFGNHHRIYAAALRLIEAGIRVRAVVDSRSARSIEADPGAVVPRSSLVRAGVECLCEHAVVAARGRTAVAGAWVEPLAPSNGRRRIDCNAILVSGGWSPNLQVTLHEAGARRFSPSIADFTADDQPDWRIATGAANGELELGTVMSNSYAVGARAARAMGHDRDAGAAPNADGDRSPDLVPFWRSPATRRQESRQFVDLQNDVTVADLRQALAEGFTHIEHVKRYTTLGTGTDQGRACAVLGAAIVSELRGVGMHEVGVSRTRIPYHPVAIGVLVGSRSGARWRVTRRTPLHECHLAHGAVMEPAGHWIRPRFYRTNGPDARSAGLVEAAHVRTSGGIFDGSTLGKIEIAGTDAAAFLDRLYLTRASTIEVGRSRYMVSLREDGMVLDDGVVLRLAPDRFVATTSTGHADRMLSHFEFYRDTEWGGAEVAIVDVTDAWAVIVVAGPRSRETLAFVLGAAWKRELAQMAHMEFAAGAWRERELRVVRASFSGELAYELHCRPEIAASTWESFVEAGLAPYGLEALEILRLEKGYLSGSEINGQTTPLDLCLARHLQPGHRCVGRALLDRPAFREPARPVLVGLRASDGASSISAGAQITATDAPNRSLGHVTAATFSPMLREWIGLGLVSRTVANEGATLLARDPLQGHDTEVRITRSVHFDPLGERLRS